jgi:LacI family transcriptional regulator
MERVNIKQLAAMLNLSIATVSKALRDSYDISKATKEKVIELATRLNYEPNPHASSLRRNKSKTIAVIVPEIANNYFALAINGIESVAEENGFHVLIYLTHEDFEKEKMFARHLLSGRVDGVLVSISGATTDYTHLRALEQKDIPVVYFDRVSEAEDTKCITTDDFESSRLATAHLITKGCSRIAHLAISQHTSIGKKRKGGYLQALADHNIPVDDSLIIYCSNSDGENAASIADLLLHKKCDGIFAAVEKYAITTYEQCNTLNIPIPQRVKVIAFSNLQTASLLNPPLTTITQPAFDIGREAARILFNALNKKIPSASPENIILKSLLIERDSTSGE